MIKRVRNEATLDSLQNLFQELTQHVIEMRLEAKQIFNMDETPFS